MSTFQTSQKIEAIVNEKNASFILIKCQTDIMQHKRRHFYAANLTVGSFRKDGS